MSSPEEVAMWATVIFFTGFILGILYARREMKDDE